MIECSLFALVVKESVQELKEHMTRLGCTCTSYNQNHTIFVHEEKQNLKCRIIEEDGIMSITYISPPDSNASRSCTVETVEMSTLIQGSPLSFLKTAGFVELKSFSTKGFKCQLEKAFVDCIHVNDTWIIRLYFTTKDGGKIEFLEERLHLFASRYFPSLTFHHPEPSSYN